jgi:hypothetical protein
MFSYQKCLPEQELIHESLKQVKLTQEELARA